MQNNTDRRWRKIPIIETNGTMQMAIDRYLLEGHIAGLLPPTLRFYQWSPAAISLGYHQHRYPQEWQNLNWNDRPLDLVKRPTGGRAVLHQGDLTYALIISGLSGKRSDIYQQISQFIIDGFQSIGISLKYGDCQARYIANPNCFALATGADLVCEGGYKLIGSAQVIRSEAILQHGSIRLNPDPQLFERVFGTTMPAPPVEIATLSPDSIVTALTAAAARHFQVEFDSIPLSTREKSTIADFCPETKPESVDI